MESGGGITSTVFLRSSHTNSNCSQNTEALDTAFVYLSLANPVLKPEVSRTQAHERSYSLCVLGEMPIPTVKLIVTTLAQC